MVRMLRFTKSRHACPDLDYKVVQMGDEDFDKCLCHNPEPINPVMLRDALCPDMTKMDFIDKWNTHREEVLEKAAWFYFEVRNKLVENGVVSL